MIRILVFGASITAGCGDPKGGWVHYLRQFLLEERRSKDNRAQYQVHNLGISGDTSKEVLDRIEFEIEKRKNDKENTIIILSVGANDSLYLINEKRLRREPEEYGDNIDKIIKIAQKHASKIFFVGLNPIDESKVNPIPWGIAGRAYKTKYIKEFNQTAKTVCEKNNIPFIDLFTSLDEINFKELLADGIHPNTEGHKKMFEIVKKFLLENKVV